MPKQMNSKMLNPTCMQISVMGKSLGGAAAIHLAAANPGKFRTIIIENTFTSIEDVAHKVITRLFNLDPVLSNFHIHRFGCKDNIEV